MAFAPDGRLFVTEQGGSLRVVGADGTLRAAPFATVPARSDGERGLLSVAFDPAFASNGYVYVYWTNPQPRQHDTLSRFTTDPANPDAALAGSRVDLLNLPDAAAGNHLGGAMHFGADGKLYLAVGEHGNPDWAQDLAQPFGKMLRLNRDGTFPADNPFVGQAGAYGGVWAYGLRNPFTFEVEAGTGRIHINDVGSNQREEVNLGQKGANYGWPLTEGKFDPARFPDFTNPLFDYVRSLDGCAITGGTFYHAPAGAGFPWPAEYEGDYLYSDYCRTFVNRLDPANNFATASPFADNLPAATIDLDVGRQGDVFVLCRGNESAGAGSVVRIRYTASSAPSIGTQPRDAVVSAGDPVTFTVAANGSQPLTYQWQRRDAGAADFVDIGAATGATFTLDTTSTADDGDQFRAVVRNGAGSATSNPATLHVTQNRPPTATITAPAPDAHYRAGDTINFSGTGTDPEDGTLPASAFTWSVVFHHATHTHPFVPEVSGQKSGSFTIPTTGEVAADVWYRIHLTVRDSAGLVNSVYRDIFPQTANVTLATSPALPGMSINLDGTPQQAPFTFTGVSGMTRGVAAPATQTINGVTYEFVSWSDGGARAHDIVTPDAATTYTAVYRAIPQVTGRYVFYNRSAFDGASADANAADDGAIATDKVALLPGQSAGFENYTSYDRGLNGIMIDLKNGGTPVTADDFSFQVGSGDGASGWTAAPAPATIQRRNGAGVNGSDRISITWPDRAIVNQWLRVSFRPEGSSFNDVFYFGNLPGETGNAAGAATVNAIDLGQVRANQLQMNLPVTNKFDINRDGRINAIDLGAVRANQLSSLTLMTAPGGVAVQSTAGSPTATFGDALVSGAMTHEVLETEQNVLWL